MDPRKQAPPDTNASECAARVGHLLGFEALPVLAQLLRAALHRAHLQARLQPLPAIDVIHLPPLRVAQHLHACAVTSPRRLRWLCGRSSGCVRRHANLVGLLEPCEVG